MKYDRTPPTRNLSAWTASVAVEARDAVLAMVETDGWKRFTEALDAFREQHVALQVLGANPTDSVAERERNVGIVNGLQLVPRVVEGIVLNGDRCEKAIREIENGEVND